MCIFEIRDEVGVLRFWRHDMPTFCARNTPRHSFTPTRCASEDTNPKRERGRKT